MAQLLDIVSSWIAGSGLYSMKRPHTPSRSRLAKKALIPLCHEIVSPTPTSTYPARVTALLDAAEDALNADLATASDELAHLLADLGLEPELRRSLTSDDLQSRVAIRMRELHLPAWRASTDDHGGLIAPIRPQWTEPGGLTAALLTLTQTRRCKLWVEQAGALTCNDFQDNWAKEVAGLLTGPPPPSSVEAGLGGLEVPDLVNDPEPDRDWRLATDRSFHNRIRLYWDGKHLPATSLGSPPDQRLAGAQPGEAVVRESITRTVAPFGLLDDAHQSLARILADAVSAAAAGGAMAEAPPLPEQWECAPTTSELQVAVRRHVSIRLAKRRVAVHELDEVLFGQCVARRVWVRLHAWELRACTIPARDLLVSLNSALDTSRLAAGVTGASLRGRSPSEQRVNNTIDLIHTLQTDGPDDPSRIAAKYRQRYATARFDPKLQKAGGILTPRQVERLLSSRGTS